MSSMRYYVVRCIISESCDFCKTSLLMVLYDLCDVASNMMKCVDVASKIMWLDMLHVNAYLLC